MISVLANLEHTKMVKNSLRGWYLAVTIPAHCTGVKMRDLVP